MHVGRVLRSKLLLHKPLFLARLNPTFAAGMKFGGENGRIAEISCLPSIKHFWQYL
jgi:hypothetical protein